MNIRLRLVSSGLIVAALGTLSAQVTRPIPGDPVKTDAALVSGSLIGGALKAYFGNPFAASGA